MTVTFSIDKHQYLDAQLQDSNKKITKSTGIQTV